MATNKNNDRTKKPNFLFIITDQQRADWLGCMGHPVVRTPNIDSIALQGTAFEDFHVGCYKGGLCDGRVVDRK